MIRILYVDDEAELLEVCKAFLELSETLQVDTARSAYEAKGMLIDTVYDVIVCDYQMPNVNGIEFLKDLRSAGNTIPFILFTGRGHEDVVIEALNSGADFYLQKGGDPTSQFAELVHKVRQVVQKRSVELALKQSEDRFRQLIENGPVAAMCIRGGRMIYANQRYLAMHGYAGLWELEGSPITVVTAPRARDEIMAIVERRQRGLEISSEFETVGLRKDGTEFPVSVVVTQTEMIDGPATMAFITDITEEKRAVTILRTIQSNAPETILTIDAEFRVTEIMRGMDSVAGTVGTDLLETIGPEYREMARHELEKVFGTGRSGSYETMDIGPDGARRWSETHISPVLEGGDAISAVLFIKDVTERRKVEESLRRNEARNAALFELSHMSGLSPKDIAERAMDYCIELTGSKLGLIAFLNQDETVLTMQHYSRSAMKSCAIEDKPMVFNVEAAGLWAEAVRQRRSVVVNDYRSEDGRKRGLPVGHVPLTRHLSIPVMDRGRVVAVAGFSNKDYDYTDQDVMEATILMDGMWRIIRKIQAEEALRDSERMLRAIFERAPVAIGISDANGRPIDFNERTVEMLGFSREELNNSDYIRTTTHPDDLRYDLERFRELRDGSVSRYEIEKRYLRKDGRIVWSKVNVSRVEQGEGRPDLILAIADDITERKKADAELREKEHFVERMVMLEPSGLFIYDVNEQRISFINERIVRKLGLTREKIAGVTNITTKLLHPDDVAKGLALIRKVVMGKDSESHGDELRLRGSDGWFWVRFIGVPFRRKGDGGVDQILFNVIDISQSKKVEDELRQTNLKLNLLSDITRHDIGNQLITQKGNIDLLKGEVTDPEVLRRLVRVEESIMTIQNQIEFGKAYGEVGIDAPTWQPIGQILSTLPVVKELESLEIGDDVADLSVFADPMLVKVIHNLMENSLKYGGGPVHARLRSRTVGNSLILSYEDNGVGIPFDLKERIFEKGFGKGTGLGLFLSRMILELTDIHIVENGEPGKGARFEIAVPPGGFRFSVDDGSYGTI